MSDIGVISARAPSLEKLEQELASALSSFAADDVLAVSHSVAAISGKQSGGVWGGGSSKHRLEYSAVVLLRAVAG